MHVNKNAHQCRRTVDGITLPLPLINGEHFYTKTCCTSKYEKRCELVKVDNKKCFIKEKKFNVEGSAFSRLDVMNTHLNSALVLTHKSFINTPFFVSTIKFYWPCFLDSECTLNQLLLLLIFASTSNCFKCSTIKQSPHEAWMRTCSVTRSECYFSSSLA